MIRKKIQIALVGMFVALMLITVPYVSAADKPKAIPLTFSTSFPKPHPFNKADSAWMEKITRETNGRVAFTVQYGGTLIPLKQAWDEIRAGVADIANVVPSFGALRSFPLNSAVDSFFYGSANYDITMVVAREIQKQFPQIDAEFKDVKVLCRNGVGSKWLHTIKKPVRTLDDVKGSKMIAVSPVMFPVWKQLGGTIQRIPPTELYISMEKGIIDSAVLPLAALRAFRLSEVASFHTNISQFGFPLFSAIVMNRNSWSGLPPDVQKVFNANQGWWEQERFKTVKMMDQMVIKLVGKQPGQEFIDLPKAELEKLGALIEAQVLKTVSKLNKAGLPGTAIFEKTRTLIKENNP